MGNIQSFWYIHICFSQVKAFSFDADPGISVVKLMINSGENHMNLQQIQRLYMTKLCVGLLLRSQLFYY